MTAPKKKKIKQTKKHRSHKKIVISIMLLNVVYRIKKFAWRKNQTGMSRKDLSKLGSIGSWSLLIELLLGEMTYSLSRKSSL
jgi:hypothetical protein